MGGLMEVLDIIQRAAFNCGVISSFDVDEFPGDVQAAGHHLLESEVLPSLNCDRSLDTTMIARTFMPSNNLLTIKPLSQNNTDIIIGTSIYASDKVLSYFTAEVTRLAPDFATTWPTDDADNARTVGMWTTDHRYVYATSLTNAVIDPAINIEFQPMRIDAMLEDANRIPYRYLYRQEFESLEFKVQPFTYTDEVYEDSIILHWHGSQLLKLLIIPVPLYIVHDTDSNNPYAGQINCPPKFKQFLVDTLAMRLSIVYGLSTTSAMQGAADMSYNMLKKNLPLHLHAPNPAEAVRDVLKRTQNNRWRFDGLI